MHDIWAPVSKKTLPMTASAASLLGDNDGGAAIPVMLLASANDFDKTTISEDMEPSTTNQPRMGCDVEDGRLER